MKKSLRFKLAVLLFAMTAGIIIINLLFNMFFLEKYYLKSRERAILSVYHELKEEISQVEKEEETQTDSGSSSFDSEKPTVPGDVESDMDVPYINVPEADSNFSDEAIRRLSSACEKNGVSAYAIDKKGNLMFAYGSINVLHQRLYGMLFGETGGYRIETIEMTDTYGMQILSPLQGDRQRYLELYGVMEEEQVFFLLRVAIESIEESVAVSNRFYVIVNSILLVICIITLWFASRSFTKPILKLANLSKDMTALHFDAKYNGKRQDEIGVLGNSMNELSETLEKTITDLKSANLQLQNDIRERELSAKTRTEFLSNVSHELKTPLALIQGYAEGLKDCVNDDAESRDYYCDVILDETQKMNRMVKKLLTLNQIESGMERPEIHRLNLTEQINGVLNSVNILLKQKEIQVYFDVEQPCEIWADEFEIEEVLTNYISNAINHCEGKREIRIWLEDKGDLVRVNVYNTGQPIPEEDLGKIWDKFYKVDKARTREYGGNGIGLSIVKAIMESLGQAYGAENREDGVVFWFEADKRAAG